MSDKNEITYSIDSEIFVAAFKEVQRQTAEAHESFQKSMSEAHLAYLSSTEQSFKDLVNLLDKEDSNIDSLTTDQKNDFINKFEAEFSKKLVKKVLRQGAETVKSEDQKNDVDEKLNHAIAENFAPKQIKEEEKTNTICSNIINGASKIGEQQKPLNREILKTENMSNPNDESEYFKALEDGMLKNIPNLLKPNAPETHLYELENIRKIRTLVESKVKTHQIPELWPILSLHKVFVSGCGTSVGPYFCELLRKKGIQVVTGSQIPNDAKAVIFLGGLRPVNTKSEALRVNFEAFQIAKEAVQIFGNKPGIFIMIQDTGGQFCRNLQDPLRHYITALTALTSTLKQEQSLWITKLIDIQQGMKSYKDIASNLIKEIAFGGSETIVGIMSTGKRYVLEDRPAALKKGQNPLQDEDSLIITEGARNLTNYILDDLGKEKKLNLFYIQQTRTHTNNKPSDQNNETIELKSTPPEIEETFKKWEKLGHKVQIITCNLLNTESIKLEIDRLTSENYCIRGLLHTSTHIDYKFINSKTHALFNKRMAYKSQSILNLLSSLDHIELKLIVFYSSIFYDTRLGTCDQMISNEICNKIALFEAKKRQNTCLVKSICSLTDQMSFKNLEEKKLITSNPELAKWIKEELSQEPDSSAVEVLYERISNEQKKSVHNENKSLINAKHNVQIHHPLI